MSADIEIVTRAHPAALRVPSYAVHESDVDRFVYALGGDGKVERRAVTIGYWNWDFAEVATGLVEGDAVVVSLDLKDLAPGKPAVIAREIKKVAVE
jgi:hypothetical protein